jgi:hypothetical protein
MKIKSLFTLQVVTKEKKGGELEACCELLAPNIQATIERTTWSLDILLTNNHKISK